MKKIKFKLTYDEATCLSKFLERHISQPKMEETLANLLLIHTIEMMQYIDKTTYFKFEKPRKYELTMAQSFTLHHLIKFAPKDVQHPFELANLNDLFLIIDKQMQYA